ncbi:hypothetical protein KDW_31190 [Dictyobacter vulcani]|uniref:Uncharacterized protein n=1 Tax=Dictyobacter vulcani TaxID=2607529 RepID=A0A5J4KRH3_9CHLR|nr:hypothetical protein [Dictyobacter vulcani]GER88957.1 hypothetical protein KDW_31190 [Dictyobacter vulcani]
MAFSYSVSQAGNLFPRVYNYLCVLPDKVLHHTEHNLRHPLAIYSISINRVLQAFENILRENAKIYSVDWTTNNNADFNVGPLLSAEKELLDASMAHIDDGYQILKALCSISKTTKQIQFADKWLETVKHPTVRNYKHGIKTYRDSFAPIVNKIKHEHGRLQIVVMHDALNEHDKQRRIAGYFLEGVDKQGTVGPDQKIHSGKYAISFHRDLRYHFVHLFMIGEYLADAIIQAISQDYHVSLPANPRIEAPWEPIANIAQSIHDLPFIFYPDELNKLTPSVIVNGSNQSTKILLTRISPLKADAFLNWRIQIQFSGDNVTRSWKLPYFGI